jgi:hypothetical protein
MQDAQQAINLRTPEDQLAQARKQYVNSITNKQQLEKELLIIIPDLERLWKEKILVPFEFPDDVVMDWRQYLNVFKPQLLAKGIHQLASRLDAHAKRFGSVHPQPELQPTAEEVYAAKNPNEMKERINRAGGVQNVRALYRSLVQELRREEMKANPPQSRFNETIMIAVLEQAAGFDISFNLPKQTYDDAGIYLPADHRKFALGIGWIEEGASDPNGKPGEPAGVRDKLTKKGEAALLGLQGGIAIAFLAALR